MKTDSRCVSYRLIVRQHKTLELTIDQFRQLASLKFIRVSKRDKTLARLHPRLGARILNDGQLELFVLEMTPIQRHALKCLLGRWMKMIGKTTADASAIKYWRFNAGTFVTDDSRDIERMAALDDEPMKQSKRGAHNGR